MINQEILFKIFYRIQIFVVENCNLISCLIILSYMIYDEFNLQKSKQSFSLFAGKKKNHDNLKLTYTYWKEFCYETFQRISFLLNE